MRIMEQHILRRWLEVHGMTVEELAEAAGCTPPAIRNLMAGRRNASLSLAKRLSELSGGVVPMDAFLMKSETAD